MKVSLNHIIIYLFIDIIPEINNYNPMKIKNKKIGNLYNNNNINIIENNNRQNNFKRQQKNQNLYGGFNVNNYDSTRPIKLLNNPIYKNSTSTDKAKKSINLIIIIFMDKNLNQINLKLIKLLALIQKGLQLLLKNLKFLKIKVAKYLVMV